MELGGFSRSPHRASHMVIILCSSRWNHRWKLVERSIDLGEQPAWIETSRQKPSWLEGDKGPVSAEPSLPVPCSITRNLLSWPFARQVIYRSTQASTFPLFPTVLGVRETQGPSSFSGVLISWATAPTSFPLFHQSPAF